MNRNLLIQAARELRGISADLQASARSKTAFNSLVEEGFLRDSEAEDYLEDLAEKDPQVAEEVTQVIRKNTLRKTAGFGQAVGEGEGQVDRSSRNMLDDDFMNLDF